MWKLWLVCLLASCSGVRSARDHLDAADKALRDGRLADARAEINEAHYKVQQEWQRAESRNLSARVRVEEVRQELPELSVLPLSRENIDMVFRRIALVRENGGDDALEAELYALVDDSLLAWARTASADGSHVEDGRMAKQMARIAHSDAARAAMDEVLRHAAETHEARAAAVGTGRRLAEKAHRTLAAFYRGTELPQDPALIAEVAYGIDVTVTGTRCPQLDDALRSTSPTAPRRAKVTVDIERCELTSDQITERAAVEWDHQRLLRIEKRPVTEKVCGYRPVAVPAPGYDCTGYGDRYSCTSATSSIQVYLCDEVTRIVEQPIYETTKRSGVRETTTRTSRIDFHGRITATRDAVTETGAYSLQQASREQTAPAVGDLAAIDGGEYIEPEKLLSQAVYEAQSMVALYGRRALFGDTQRAMTDAAALTGDDGEEAWARAVMLGSPEVGPWKAYNLDAGALTAAIAGSLADAWEGNVWIPNVRPLETVQRPANDDGAISPSEIADLETLLPVPFARTAFFALDSSWLRVSSASDGGIDRGSQGAGLLGLHLGRSFLGRGHRYGLRPADELSLRAVLGARVAGADTGTLAYHARAGYALGLGYRTYRRGAVFAGVRGLAGRFSAGGAIANYASVPAFARLELPARFATLSVEGAGHALAGTPYWSGTLEISFKQGDGYKPTQKYLSFRIERMSPTMTLGAPSDASMAMELEVDNLDVTTYTLNVGIGGDS